MRRRPTTSANRLRLLAAAWLCAGLLAGPALAYETDQLTNRHIELRDSAPVLDREVNRALDEVLAQQRPGADERDIVQAIFRRIGGRHWVDRLERWAMRSPEVEKLPTPRLRSFYRDLPLHASRVSGLFGIGPSFRVGDTLIGSDKIGHFLGSSRVDLQACKLEYSIVSPK